MTVTNPDQEIQDFLAFMREHGGQDLQYQGTGGHLRTKGCDGVYGGCCSKAYDLTSLVDTLQELTAKSPEVPQ